jgi:hypothetical protein
VLDFARPSQKGFSSPASEGPIGAWAKCASGLPANAHYRNSIETSLDAKSDLQNLSQRKPTNKRAFDIGGGGQRLARAAILMKL